MGILKRLSHFLNYVDLDVSVLGLWACEYGCWWGPEVLSTRDLQLQALVNHITWVLGSKPGPLQEECMLLTTEPFSGPMMEISTVREWPPQRPRYVLFCFYQPMQQWALYAFTHYMTASMSVNPASSVKVAWLLQCSCI